MTLTNTVHTLTVACRTPYFDQNIISLLSDGSSLFDIVDHFY